MQGHSHRRRSGLRRVVTLAVALTSLVVAPVGSSAAGSQCWETILDDWGDGAITGTYPVTCYREALRRMPEDVRLYSSATDDITRALAQRLLAKRAPAASAEPAESAPRSLEQSDMDAAGPSAPLVLAGGLSLAGLLAAAGLLLWARRTRRHAAGHPQPTDRTAGPHRP